MPRLTFPHLDACESALVQASNHCDEWIGEFDIKTAAAADLTTAIDVALRIVQRIKAQAEAVYERSRE